MSTLTLPPDTVEFYNDGPDWPPTPELQAAERTYRDAYLSAARETTVWEAPDRDIIKDAWEARRQARDEAQALVPSADLFGLPELDSEQIVYRVGHEVAASRTRARVQAFDSAARLWNALGQTSVPDGEIIDSILKPWVERLETWSETPIDQDRIAPPPAIEDLLTEAHRRMLDTPPNLPSPSAAKPASAKSQLLTRRLSVVTRETLDWLWPGRIPLGKLTLLAGDPGLGKSFVTLDMAARVSCGDPWPDLPLLQGSPAGVVLFNAEDDLADTIAPRLDKAGADDRNIVAVEGVAMLGHRRHFSLEQDVPRLEEVLAENPDTQLVVIDPISAYTGSVDSHKNAEVRGLLAPLAELAGRRRVAVVAVTHLSKSGGSKAVYRAMGSLAFAAAARAVWAIVKDPSDPQRRLFLPAKLNVAQDPDGLAYRIKEGRVAWETDPVRQHADDAFAEEMRAANGASHRGADRREAIEWVREQLAGGKLPSSQLIADAKENGMSERTLRRAFKAVGGRAKKDGGQWFWSLPDQDGQQIGQDGH